jgi:hypothetical protein
MLHCEKKSKVRRAFGMDEPIDKPWDDSLRTLIRANPQAFVTWVLGKAQFVRGLPEKLKS